MAEREITRYETVEKTETVKVCDSCGTDESELPDETGEFHTVLENVEVTADTPIRDNRIDRTRVHPDGIAGRSTKVYVVGDSYDLCPICYGAMLGDD